MKKMKTLFKKDASHRATPKIQCEWAISPNVTAHVKKDGSSCMVKDGILYKRYDAKRNRKTGEFKTPPEGAIPCCEPDLVTGHWPHWVKCTTDDKWHMEAFNWVPEDGTYELIGPKVNGNNENSEKHRLITHKANFINHLLPEVINYESMKLMMQDFKNEGIVFHHDDGRMCKVRRSDFGFKWPIDD